MDINGYKWIYMAPVVPCISIYIHFFLLKKSHGTTGGTKVIYFSLAGAAAYIMVC